MPTVELSLCLKCFACVSACPNGAISESPKGPKFDGKKCKTCGTCVEMCPASALRL